MRLWIVILALSQIPLIVNADDGVLRLKVDDSAYPIVQSKQFPIDLSRKGKKDMASYTVIEKPAGMCSLNCKFDAVDVTPKDPAETWLEFGASARVAFAKLKARCLNLCSPGNDTYVGKDGRQYRRSTCRVDFCTGGVGQATYRKVYRGRSWNGTPKYYYNYTWVDVDLQGRMIREHERCDNETGPSGPLNDLVEPEAVRVYPSPEKLVDEDEP